MSGMKRTQDSERENIVEEMPEELGNPEEKRMGFSSLFKPGLRMRWFRILLRIKIIFVFKKKDTVSLKMVIYYLLKRSPPVCSAL